MYVLFSLTSRKNMNCVHVAKRIMFISCLAAKKNVNVVHVTKEKQVRLYARFAPLTSLAANDLTAGQYDI